MPGVGIAVSRLRWGLSALILSFAWMMPASATAGHRTEVSYRGYSIAVPAGWPVYNLIRDPTTCVRFNRHAVYLGTPRADQRCPAHSVGRTEAILIEPISARASGSGSPGAPALPPGGSSARLPIRSRGVVVTATWGAHPGLVRRALGVGSLRPTVATASTAPPRARQAQTGGAVYTGLGFDPCAAPSIAHMSAWRASPYHAIGVYIGGADMACAQPNLTASWVSTETAAGWRLIPTYVGLQAPSNSCGCSGITPSRASSQGTAAATDAIARAQAVGMGSGSPIYFDMEAYPRGGSNSATVLNFLSAWTTQLHASGYRSGVYSGGVSGAIGDLAARWGTTYPEPDDIWIANWNGRKSTSDPYVSDAPWSFHQRLHQYAGGHDERYGGVTINIDNDYLDGHTAFGVGTAPPAPSPSLSVVPAGDGTINLYASWSGMNGVTQWRVLAGSTPPALTQVGLVPSTSGTTQIAMHSSFFTFEVQALGSSGQVLGVSQVVPTPPHIAIAGRSAFVPRRGFGGIPVECLTGIPCSVRLTISSGRTVIARTGPESIRTAGGLVYFALTRAGRARLAAAGSRLPVTVRASDASGATATARLTLVPFSVSGNGPHRALSQSPTLKIIGLTDFVSRRGVGGILAGCFDVTQCYPSATITAQGATIATTGNEFLGANELGYMIFTLTPAGRALLEHARGNQLAARVTLTSGTATATAGIVLVRFR
jgi:hypothetical protein